MPSSTHSEAIISAMLSSAETLIRERFLEATSYRGENKPIRLSVTHAIDARDDGSYRIKSSVAFGIRLSYGRTEDLTVPKAPAKPSQLRSVPAAAIARAA